MFSGWTAFVLTIIGVYLTVKKNVWCWSFLIVANFFWTYNLWGNAAAITMQVALFVFNVYGFFQWRENGQQI